MSKYTVKPHGTFGLAEHGMAKMFTEDRDGRKIEQGDYKNALLPKGARSHRVMYDTKRGAYDILLSHEELNKIAEEMQLVDYKTKKVIEKADKRNEFDPFFKHEELVIDIPNSGITFDDETALGRFWLAAIKSEPKLFNINNTTDNPLVKKDQMFKVTTAGHNEEELSRTAAEGMRATDAFHSLKDDFEELKRVCRCMDISIGENPSISMLRQAVYIKITEEKDFKTNDGVRFIERFLSVTDMSADDRHTRAAITEAVDLNIIKREGRKLVFDGKVLGTSIERVFRTLQEEKSRELKGTILALIKEKKGLTEVVQ